TPARAVGLARRGSLRAGFDANLVVLDRDLRVAAVMANGEWQAVED
ncbi:amidohydrolase family protein, partial [Mycobacterium ulcerans]